MRCSVILSIKDTVNTCSKFINEIASLTTNPQLSQKEIIEGLVDSVGDDDPTGCFWDWINHAIPDNLFNNLDFEAIDLSFHILCENLQTDIIKVVGTHDILYKFKGWVGDDLCVTLNGYQPR
jgi:hypothetical protein